MVLEVWGMSSALKNNLPLFAGVFIGVLADSARSATRQGWSERSEKAMNS